MQARLTDKHFKVFKEEVSYWQKKLFLGIWRIDFTFKRDITCRAWFSYNIPGMTVNLCLSSIWNNTPQKEVTDYLIRRTAFHETVEVFLCKLADCSSWSREVTEQATHEIIRSLESSIFIEDYERRFKKEKVK